MLFLTAKAGPGERDALLERGALGVLVKPFDPMGLPAAISEALAGSTR